MKRALPLVLLLVIALPIAFARWMRGADAPEPAALAPRAAIDASAHPAAALDADALGADARTPDAAPPARAATVATGGEVRSVIGGQNGSVRGRVVVGLGASPTGLRIGCVDERGQQAPQHLLADGAFAFDELRPGRVWLEADGLDDVVWRAPRKELLLHAGERIELVWDLSDRQPALVELTLKFDGLPTGGVANPLFDGLMQGESIPFAADGKALWRTAHEGELSFQARNFDGGESLAGVARLGTSGPLGRTRRGARQQFEIAIDTALVRVVRADAGAAMTRVGAQPVRASVSMPAQGAAADGTALAGGLVMLSLSLEPTREPLGQFRAGPGRYSLSSMSREGFWECELEVAQAGAAVDAQLALTPVPER